MSDRERLRRAKENLLSAGLLASASSALPDRIERSWRRSISQGVTPERTGLVEPVEADRDERLLTAARPVLDRLAEEVADLCVGVVLSDADGIIIDRFVRNRSQLAELDRAGALIGSDFAERAVGTNGLGSVIEERTPLFVRGGEHFIEALEDISCAGVPIFDPSTRRVRGSLSLTCTAARSNPLMLTLALTAARDIEQRLMDGRSRGLLDIASAFARASSAHSGALAMITPSTVLANTAGLSYVSPANHAAIWERLVADRVEQPAVLRVELVEGAVDLRARRVHVTDEQLAFQVAFSPVRRRPAPAVHGGTPWHPLPNVNAELRSVGSTSPVVVVAGEPGSGKAHVARRMLQAAGGSYEEIDPAADRSPWAPGWSGSARFAIAAGSRVLLRHVEGIPAAEHARLRALLDAAAEAADGLLVPTRLVLTVDRERAEPDLLTLLDRSASVLELPALSAMRSRIPLLVQQLVDQYPADRRCIISPAAMRALVNREWNANLSELRHVVHNLVARHPGAVVGQVDIPAAANAVPRGRLLSPLEHSERAVITAALRESQGNRSQAARILGIGRTTLYRKLRALRIEDDELSG